MTDNRCRDVAVVIPPTLRSFIDSAVVRIGYLHPSWVATATDGVVSLNVSDSHSDEEVRRELLYAVYREKILGETIGMRRQLMDAVMHS